MLLKQKIATVEISIFVCCFLKSLSKIFQELIHVKLKWIFTKISTFWDITFIFNFYLNLRRKYYKVVHASKAENSNNSALNFCLLFVCRFIYDFSKNRRYF